MKAKRLLLVLALVLGLSLLLVAFGCQGDDDDDDDDQQAEGVEEIIGRIVSELDTDGLNGAWAAYVLSEPLSEDDQIAPAEGESAYEPDGDYWFAYLDEDPFAGFEHEVRYVFIDADSGAMTVEEQGWWPEVNGTALFVADLDLVKVYGSAVAQGIQTSASGGPEPLDDPPEADYGDAPDDTESYLYGAITGHFPTLYATDNSQSGEPGGHTLTVGEETLGRTVSAETDADDPSDPDNMPNLVNNDLDDRVFWMLYPNYASNTVSVRFLVEVAVASGAPDTDRYLNILIDHNTDGQWTKNKIGREWLIENFAVRVKPGTARWVWTDPIQLPLNPQNKFGFECWVRVALTRSAVDGTPFGGDGWDGSGGFEYGEIEDHYFIFLPWYGPGDDDDDDDDDDDTGDDDDDTGDDDDDVIGPVEPPIGPAGDDVQPKDCKYVCPTDEIEIPVECKALVINLGDTPGNRWMERNGEKAQDFFQQYYGDGNSTLLNRPTADQALEAIENFFSGMKCLDELFVYIVGHGGRSGYIRAQNGGDRFKVKDLNDKIGDHSHCPEGMDYYAGECQQPGYCNLNFLIQSCYSGNFIDGDDTLELDGVNVLTSASKSKKSCGTPTGDGSYLSNAFWDAHKNGKADDPPGGNDDGEVSNEEAMEWAKENCGGPDSDPQTHAGADCDCVCVSPEWGWEDPENDMIFWYEPGDPAYVSHLDVLGYGIRQTPEGFDALITAAGDLPGPGDMFFHEYYATFDANPAWPNFMEPGPTNEGDTAYIAQFLEGLWTMFLFKYLPGEGWTQVDTTSTVETAGPGLVMHIDAAEAGVDIEETVPVHMATWYRESGCVDAGDDTAVQEFQLSAKRICPW